MDISNQIRSRRVEMGLSQDELARRVYVSRQTVSNWENDRTCPDVQSLLLLSTLFGTSIDVLVKGDLHMMDERVAAADDARMKRLAWAMIGGFVVMAALALAGQMAWGLPGALGGVLAGFVPTMAAALAVERIKRDHDVQTYREIAAFLDEKNVGVPAREHDAKRGGAKVMLLKLACGALVGGAVAGLFATLLRLATN